MMTASEARVCACAIRQLKLRANEQHQVLSTLPQRFPSAFVEAVQEVLNRFEERLSCEKISIEVSNGASSLDVMNHRNQHHN